MPGLTPTRSRIRFGGIVSRRREGGEIAGDAVREGRFFFFFLIFDEADNEEEEEEASSVWDCERVKRGVVVRVVAVTAFDIAGRARVDRPSRPLAVSSASIFRFRDSDEEEVLSSPKSFTSVVCEPSFLVTRWKYLFSRPLKDSVLLTGTSSLSSPTEWEKDVGGIIG